MKRLDILGYIMIGFIVLICIIIYQKSDTFNLRCIISDVDGNTYCVRDREMIEPAADKLARTVTKCKNLISYMRKHHPNNDVTKRLVNGFNPKKVMETLPTSEHTAYSENKGEKLAFCLNSGKNNSNKLIDENTLTFVALHELAHIGTLEVGHTPTYWQNFKFILENAVEADIYIPVDYKKKPVGYCGMTITDNPYYDI
jgi:hypothetical protein|tara:strand:+ start:1152 stop:1748 length:597 start_codon:yes stop_codon:yes gene_type:complete